MASEKRVKLYGTGGRGDGGRPRPILPGSFADSATAGAPPTKAQLDLNQLRQKLQASGSDYDFKRASELLRQLGQRAEKIKVSPTVYQPQALAYVKKGGSHYIPEDVYTLMFKMLAQNFTPEQVKALMKARKGGRSKSGRTAAAGGGGASKHRQSIDVSKIGKPAAIPYSSRSKKSSSALDSIMVSGDGSGAIAVEHQSSARRSSRPHKLSFLPFDDSMSMGGGGGASTIGIASQPPSPSVSQKQIAAQQALRGLQGLQQKAKDPFLQQLMRVNRAHFSDTQSYHKHLFKGL